MKSLQKKILKGLQKCLRIWHGVCGYEPKLGGFPFRDFVTLVLTCVL
jgi:hypothetical protein